MHRECRKLKSHYSKKVDANQPLIVKRLRALGVSVETDKDDILCGWQGKTYWFEIKNTDCLSKKTGKIKESEIKPSQKKLRAEWRGQYAICSSLEEILEIIGITARGL